MAKQSALDFVITRRMYLIETSPAAMGEYTSVAALLSEEELAELKHERPDLAVSLATKLPDTEEVVVAKPQEEVPPELQMFLKPISLTGLKNTKLDIKEET